MSAKLFAASSIFCIEYRSNTSCLFHSFKSRVQSRFNTFSFHIKSDWTRFSLSDSSNPGWVDKNILFFIDTSDLPFILSREERREVSQIISFIENCGLKKRLYHGDDFDSFLRKFVDDSLTLDQACFEIVPSQFCKPYEFFCIDGATVRFASPELENEIIRIGKKVLTNSI